MSALAHTSTHHTNVDSVQLNSEPAVTSISVTARIDYIQRFSKQAVLVIDNNIEAYSQVARQFLISLSKENTNQETNVAFVSASTKLNDIQMRCRLIEQLFANTLFDPERSLAVSILQLSKQSKESITIVVEHAHALSLQMKYELCQLVDVANKTHNKINVALFGKEQAVLEVASNRTIFNNKLAIIDAKSGQLFALDHTKFKNGSAIFTKKFWQKLMITAMSVSMLIGISWYVLIEFDSFSLSKLPLFNTTETEQVATKKNSETNTAQTVNERVEQATTEDVQAALSGSVPLLAKVKNNPAKSTDILEALALDIAIEPKSLVAEQAAPEQVAPEQVKIPQTKPPQVNALVNVDLPMKLTPQYYLNLAAGYAVQIVGFSDMTLLSRFIAQHPNIEYFSYQRILNGQAFVVLTTKVFASKERARIELQLLPEAIIERGVWIKELSIIKTEIAALN